MKKMLYAIGLVAPLLATSVSASDVVSDFFANEETALKVVRYYGGEEGTKARVKGTLVDEHRVLSFDVEGKLKDAGWKINDSAFEATALKIGNLELGREDFVRLPGIHGDPVAYTPLDDTEELQGELTPGSIVSVNHVQNWLRPDGTTHSIIGDALFRLRLDEEREVVGGEFKT